MCSAAIRSRQARRSRASKTEQPLPDLAAQPRSLSLTKCISRVTQTLGCYADSNISRTLPHSRGSWSQMTQLFCTELCRPDATAKSTYVGDENGDECWCGDSMQSPTKVDDSFCATPCAGNASETCGGAGYVHIFEGDCLPCCSRWCRPNGKCTVCTQHCGRGRGPPGRGGWHCCRTGPACCEDQKDSCDATC